MSESRHDRVARLFGEACKLAEEKRPAFLALACGGDEELRREVEALLAKDGAETETGVLGAIRDDAGAAAADATTAANVAGMIPQRIGQYHIKQRLESGGMGIVYVAVQEHPRRTVAVKVMKRGIASRSAARRFEYESQILARLRHPNIAKVYEAGTHDDGQGGVPFFAMEYVPNPRSITEYARFKELDLQHRLRLFEKVCDAVHHGHQKGIIHRDLKPANILVDSSGEPKIIDFGVARATDSDMAITTLQTDIGQLVGTLQYMSPEQCEADPHDLDTRSDVYALGVVLYELLTDRLPYDVSGSAIPKAVEVVREASPARLSSIDRTLRGDVETIVLKALEKDRDRRYQSAARLRDDIEHYLQDEPIEAVPQSVGYRISKYVRRHRAGAAITALFLVSGVLALTVAFNAMRASAASARAEAADARAEAAEARSEATELRMEADVLEAARVARRQEVLDAVRFYATDLTSMMPADLEAQEFLTDRAVSDLDRLMEESPDDPELMFEMARAYREVAEVQWGLRGPSLGHVDEAMESYRSGKELVETLRDRSPDNAAVAELSALIDIDMGQALDEVNRYDESHVHFRDAWHTLMDLARRHDDLETRRLSGVALLEYGKSRKSAGRVDEANERYREAAALFETLLTEHPDDDQLQRDLSVAYNRVAGSTDDPDEKIQLFTRALDIREQLLETLEESRPRERRDLAMSHSMLGDVHLKQGNTAAALPHYERFVDLAIELVWEDPLDDRPQRDLALAHPLIAGIHSETGDADQAIDRLLLCREPLRRRAASDPADAGRRQLVLDNNELLGALLIEGGFVERGLAQLDKALEVARGLAETPGGPGHRAAVARLLTRIGVAQAAAGRPSEARDRLQGAISLFDLLDSAGTLEEDVRGWSDEAHNALQELEAPPG